MDDAAELTMLSGLPAEAFADAVFNRYAADLLRVARGRLSASAALRELGNAIQLDARRPEYLETRVSVSRAKIEEWRAVPFSDGLQRQIYHQLAMNLQKEMHADYDALVRLDPTAFRFASRGGLLKSMKEYHRAIADYDSALRLRPKYHVYLKERGDVYAEQGKYAEAMADYEEATRVVPVYGHGWFAMARVYATARDMKYRNGKKALELVAKATKVNSSIVNQPVNLAIAAAAHAEARDFRQAIELQKKAIKGASTPALKAEFEDVLKDYELGLRHIRLEAE
jgi:tetratricopeptide (TPR) repeat protein